MARLQDFSDVTPSSSSDKLLIVQSAGQGLATLDTAGQQIANNTSVSQLNTTSKTLAGAINEHDSEIGTLSSLTTSDKSSVVGAVNEVNGKGYNDLSGRPIRYYMVSSSNPITIQGQIVSGYATFIIIGFVASLGGVVLAVQMSGGNLSKVIDLLTGSPFSSSHLTFSGSNSQLTIGSDVNSNSNLMIWG